MWWRSGEKPIGESGCMAGPGCAVHTVTGNRLASNVVVVVVSTKLVSTAATHAQLSLRPSARRCQCARYSRTQAPTFYKSPWGDLSLLLYTSSPFFSPSPPFLSYPPLLFPHAPTISSYGNKCFLSSVFVISSASKCTENRLAVELTAKRF